MELDSRRSPSRRPQLQTGTGTGTDADADAGTGFTGLGLGHGARSASAADDPAQARRVVELLDELAEHLLP
ncbi:hypothetical protein [Streptomyces spiralis]